MLFAKLLEHKFYFSLFLVHSLTCSLSWMCVCQMTRKLMVCRVLHRFHTIYYFLSQPRRYLLFSRPSCFLLTSTCPLSLAFFSLLCPLPPSYLCSLSLTFLFFFFVSLFFSLLTSPTQTFLVNEFFESKLCCLLNQASKRTFLFSVHTLSTSLPRGASEDVEWQLMGETGGLV